MKRSFWKVVRNIMIGILSIAIIAILSIFTWLNISIPRSFPVTEGEIQLTGLDSKVKVYRDDMGIPNIFAETSHDLFMAQGYIHAQDRFWQMDFWRHIGSGRLAEMFPSEVKTDAFLRTLGWHLIAEQEIELMNSDSLALLTAYADGVNTYLSTHTGIEISLEYGILKFLNPSYVPEPWSPVNTLTWAKSMAWDLGGNMDQEIDRAILLKTLTPELVEELFPPYPNDHPIIVSSIGNFSTLENKISKSNVFSLEDSILESLLDRFTSVDKVLGPSGVDIGSNNWVVSGDNTYTGYPLLANDPHLAIQMPSIWYQVGLHCTELSEICPFNVTGFSFAGVPGVIIGHNDSIAWGVTNVGPDVQDLFIEKINPLNLNQYEYKGEWLDMETKHETIFVAGSDPIEITVRSTIHGPIISDSYGPLKESDEPLEVSFSEKTGIDLPSEYAIALRWTALETSKLFEAIWGFNKAQNWLEFREAAESFVVPAQNLVYADIEGNIGYQMPGNIPIRSSGDGSIPVPGWTGEFDWEGYIPFNELPFAFNPSSGFIVTANNQVNPWDYPHLITSDWDYGFRADRIIDLLFWNNSPLSVESFMEIQGDNFDSSASILIPILLETKTVQESHGKYLAILTEWDYQNSMDSAPAALFSAFWKFFLNNTFGDNLPIDLQPEGSSRWIEIVRNMAHNPSSHWWDSALTPDIIETREAIINLSFTQAVNEMISIFGSEMEEWKWGEIHTATFKNQTLGESGIAPIEMLFNRGPFPTSGGSSIVNATGWSASDGYELTSLPSLRMVVDLSDLDNSFSVHTTGQSGHAFNKNYDNMVDLWRNITFYPMYFSMENISEYSGHLLILSP